MLHKCGSAVYIFPHIHLISSPVTLTGILSNGAELVPLSGFLVESLVFHHLNLVVACVCLCVCVVGLVIRVWSWCRLVVSPPTCRCGIDVRDYRWLCGLDPVLGTALGLYWSLCVCACACTCAFSEMSRYSAIKGLMAGVIIISLLLRQKYKPVREHEDPYELHCWEQWDPHRSELNHDGYLFGCLIMSKFKKQC